MTSDQSQARGVAISPLVLEFLALLALYVGCYAMFTAGVYDGAKYYSVIVLGWAIYLLGLRAAAVVIGHLLYGER